MNPFLQMLLSGRGGSPGMNMFNQGGPHVGMMPPSNPTGAPMGGQVQDDLFHTGGMGMRGSPMGGQAQDDLFHSPMGGAPVRPPGSMGMNPGAPPMGSPMMGRPMMPPGAPGMGGSPVNSAPGGVPIQPRMLGSLLGGGQSPHFGQMTTNV
jgi:hypothetical protein